MRIGIPARSLVTWVALVALALLPSPGLAAQQADVDLSTVRQWTAAPYWTLPAEAQAKASASTASVETSGAAPAASPLPFIAVTPGKGVRSQHCDIAAE